MNSQEREIERKKEKEKIRKRERQRLRKKLGREWKARRKGANR